MRWTCQVLDWPFRIEDATRSDVGREVDRVFRRLTVPPHAGKSFRIQTLSPSGKFGLTFEGDLVATSHDAASLVDVLVWNVNQQVVRHSSHLILVHAGAIATKEVGVLLPGPSGSGKSTLTAALVRDGLSYLSDEIGALDPETGFLRPYPVPINLKRGSWALFEEVPENDAQTRPSGQYLVAPGSLNQGMISPPTRLEIVVAPTFHLGEVTTLRKRSRGDGLSTLLDNLLDDRSLDAERFQALADMCRQADFYELTIGDVRDAAATVRGLLS